MAISNDTITAVATLVGSCTAFATVVVSGILRYQDRKLHNPHDDDDNDFRVEEAELEKALEALRNQRKGKGRNNKNNRNRRNGNRNDGRGPVQREATA